MASRVKKVKNLKFSACVFSLELLLVCFEVPHVFSFKYFHFFGPLTLVLDPNSAKILDSGSMNPSVLDV
jgi:hypothetical protein